MVLRTDALTHKDMKTMKKALFGYLGGKFQLSKQIIPLIPEHHCYVEPFCGAASVFFKKNPSKTEILNDLNGDLINLYRVIRDDFGKFVRVFRGLPVAREQFNYFKSQHPDLISDPIERAARFFYLLRTSYGSKTTDQTFSISTGRGSNLNLLTLKRDILVGQRRLARVYLENLPYDQVIQRYDRHDTFFYIDPPYYNCENYYGKGLFERSDFEVLRELLENLKGKFILSLNDLPEIRQIFNKFNIKPVTVRYSVQTGNTKNIPRFNELLISNF